MMTSLRRVLIVCGAIVWASTFPRAWAGALDVIPEAAFAGNRGMRVVVDDQTPAFVQDSVAGLESYSARFYINLDGLTFTSDGAFDIFAGTTQDSVVVFRIFVERVGSDTRLRYAALPNVAQEVLGADPMTITPGWHRVEMAWTLGAGNGGLQVMVDGVALQGVSNLVNTDYAFTTIRLGMVTAPNPPGLTPGFVAGSMDIDEFISRLSGLIGATPTTTGFGNVRVNVNAPTTVLNLFNAFDDEEDNDSELTYTVTGNTNETLFSSVAVDNGNGTLALVYATDATGIANVTVRATDTNDLHVETTFAVTVSGPPTTTGIANVSVNADAPSSQIDLFSAFADAEDPDDTLTFAITSNSNPGILSAATVAGGTLTLDYNPSTGGVSNITVRATDPGGLFVDAPFTVTVNAFPTTSGIADVTVTAGTQQTVIDLTDAFADAEDADADLVYTLDGNTNAALFDAAAVDNTTDSLVLAYAGTTGAAIITIRATDSGGLSIIEEFTVTVSAAGGTGCHGGTDTGIRGDFVALGLAALVLLVFARRP